MDKINISIIGIGEQGVKAVSSISQNETQTDEAVISYWGINVDDESNHFVGESAFVYLATCNVCRSVEKADFVIFCIDSKSVNNFKYIIEAISSIKENHTTICSIVTYNDFTSMDVGESVHQLTELCDGVIYVRQNNASILESVLKMITGMMDQESTIMCSPFDLRDFLIKCGDSHFVSISVKGEFNTGDVVDQIASEMPSGISINKANKVMIRIVCPANTKLSTIDELLKTTADAFNEDAELIFGVLIDQMVCKSTIEVSVIASNFMTT